MIVLNKKNLLSIRFPTQYIYVYKFINRLKYISNTNDIKHNHGLIIYLFIYFEICLENY